MAEALTGAVPLSDMAKLPTTQDQYRALQHQIDENRPRVEAARSRSDALAAQTKTLRDRLIATAAKVQALEAEKTTLDAQVLLLRADEDRSTRAFTRDRAAVSRLLAVLERLQHDLPPAMIMRADDAAGAVQSAMLMGASLPRLYKAAAALAEKLKVLRQTRETLVARRAERAHNAAELSVARNELDQLVAQKEAEASEAQSQYGDLKSRFDTVAGQAASLETLLSRVAELRSKAPVGGVMVVTGARARAGLTRESLVRPVLGPSASGGMDGVGGASAPGMTFSAEGGAQVVAPTDGQVLFAGPYQKTGRVLILQMPTGYDLVLAGLDRVSVRPGDQLLAGEPVGTMPQTEPAKLYMELRRNGKGVDPAPWLMSEPRKAQKS
ncbi:MAG TPA: peptidoglycan DD-metalloendopeptidase family protein [Rhizomicrobium sp.]|nr:peptidoglycan DD-metalloendopeptidase family protein [Rhizomicrobium sp.]